MRMPVRPLEIVPAFEIEPVTVENPVVAMEPNPTCPLVTRIPSPLAALIVPLELLATPPTLEAATTMPWFALEIVPLLVTAPVTVVPWMTAIPVLPLLMVPAFKIEPVTVERAVPWPAPRKTSLTRMPLPAMIVPASAFVIPPTPEPSTRIPVPDWPLIAPLLVIAPVAVAISSAMPAKPELIVPVFVMLPGVATLPTVDWVTSIPKNLAEIAPPFVIEPLTVERRRRPAM